MTTVLDAEEQAAWDVAVNDVWVRSLRLLFDLEDKDWGSLSAALQGIDYDEEGGGEARGHSRTAQQRRENTRLVAKTFWVRVGNLLSKSGCTHKMIVTWIGRP